MFVKGASGLHFASLVNKNADMGFLLHHPFWRKRMATEAHLLILTYAFEELKFHRITFTTLESNSRMRGFYHCFGLEQESVAKESIFCPRPTPHFVNTCTYALLDRDWPRVKASMQDKLQEGS